MERLNNPNARNLHVTIHPPLGVSFSGSKEAERAIICQLLAAASQTVGSHRDPEPLRYDGREVGYYEFGAGSLNRCRDRKDA